MRILSKSFSVSVLLAIFVACGEDATEPGPGSVPLDTIIGLTIEPDTVRLPAGQTVILSAYFVHESGALSDADSVSWINVTEDVAVINSSGELTAVAPGLGRVAAQAGDHGTTAVVRVPGWFLAASLPYGRRAAQAAALNDTICFAGGFDGNYVNNVFRYDQRQDNWTSMPSLAVPRAHAAIVTHDGQLYVIGGVAGAIHGEEDRLSSGEVFVPSTGRWAVVPSMPTPRGGVRAASLDSLIYVVGGGGGPTQYNVVEAYDPVQGEWTAAASMPTARINFAIGAINGKLYVAGGETNEVAYTGALEIYDPSTDSWSTGPDMPTPRRSVASVVWDGKLWVLGGGGDQSITSTIEFFDPVSGAWSSVTDMPIPRREANAAVANNILYVMGGITYQTPYSARVDAYIP